MSQECNIFVQGLCQSVKMIMQNLILINKSEDFEKAI